MSAYISRHRLKELGLVAFTHPILHDYVDDVTNFDADAQNDITELYIEMLSVVHATKALGLAANQIGVDMRMILFRDASESIKYMINPEIIMTSKTKSVMTESCLSLPGRQGDVERHDSILVRYQDRYGKHIIKPYSNITARIIQHEIDHLNGILYIQKEINTQNNVKNTTDNN